ARSVMSRLEEGRYRLRTIRLPGSQPILIHADGPASLELGMRRDAWPTYEAVSGPEASLVLNNTSDQEQLFILEHIAWGDDAVTAAEISTMQQFRDLFADEALRAGDQFSVGSLALLFTDIKGSTQLYNEVGDAVAFGLVLEHFDVVKEAILEEEGAIVKTIGDAVMAVFLHPAAGIRAMFKAQERLSMPPYGKRPITLKAALHYGPCIAVSLNERLDYFGSTVNMAARLEKYSQGNDVIISQQVHDDPIVSTLLHERVADFELDHFCEPIRGFEGEFQLWRVKKKG
ncbi:MAG: adenylate/guanylate cyclase domain-containing protein, partial [Chloroflexota bacterium]